MNVFEIIYDWSKSQPNWQRAALHRLIKDKELDDSDVIELTEICKSKHGLSYLYNPNFLDIEEFESFSRVNGSFFSEAKFERFDLKNRNHS